MLNLASDMCLLHKSLDDSSVAPVSQRLDIVDLADYVLSRLLINGEMDLGRRAASDHKVCDSVFIMKLLNICQ